jgi:hypothetical protein
MSKLTKEYIAGKQGLYTQIQERNFRPGFVKKPHISTMLQDAYTIIQNELGKLKAKALTDDAGFTDTEAKRFAILSDQLAKLAREEREQLRDDNINDRSDDELLEMMKEAGKTLAKAK